MKVDVWAPSVLRFGGGISQFSRELSRAINGNITIIGKYDKGHSMLGLRVFGAGAWPSMLQAPIFIFIILLRVCVSAPNLIVSTHVNFGPIAYVLKKIFKIPYILIAHGIDVQPCLSKSRKKALLGADRVLCVSRWTKSLVISLGVTRQRVGVILNTVDKSRFMVKNFCGSELKKRLGIEEHSKVMLTVARLSASEGYKGYDRLLECLPVLRREVGDVVYVVVGKGDDRERLEDMAADMELSDSVRFAGFVDDDQLPNFYRMADVFAMPSTGEGYGIVFLEAMACGTPVLAGNQDGSVDALDSGRLGVLVDPTDIGSITAGLLKQIRKEGPGWWYKPESLRNAVLQHAGRKTFARIVNEEIAKVIK